MRLHEDWREEIGWFLAVFGMAGLLFALAEIIFRVYAPNMLQTWWIIMGVATLIAIVGFVLPLTRPSRRDKVEPSDSHVGNTGT